MNFSALSIKNPVPAIMLFVLLTLGGMLAYYANPVQDFPDVELPMVIVNAKLDGAAPAQLESEVARKLEDSIATLQGVKNIYTTILDGTVKITVEFVLEKNLSEAVNDVRNAVAQTRPDLPAELHDPAVTKATTAGRELLIFTVSASPSSSQRLSDGDLSWFVDRTVTKRLLAVPGVGKVVRLGGVSRELQVRLDETNMAALNVSALEVSRQLRQVQAELSAGYGAVSGAKQSIRTIATVKTAAELADLELPTVDGRRVRLNQIATVLDTNAEQRAIAEDKRQQVVAFEVFRAKGAGEVEVARRAREAVDDLRTLYPNIVFALAVDNATPVQESFKGSIELLYEGAILSVIVVWWFLRDWRATVVAAAALPLSLLPAFLSIYLFGYTLNTVTLLSLALVVGMLVDDAIVEIENISRHLQMGKAPFAAAMEAADEIGMAVIATTFALVAVFLPTAFMKGIPGLFFKQFGWTAVVAVLASLLVARLLTPMMAAYLLRPAPPGLREDGWLMKHYLTVMRWCLANRLRTAMAAVIFFLGSLMLVPLLPTGFMPASDRNQTQVNLELPPGASLAETRDIAEKARRVALQVHGVVDVFSSIGGGASGSLFAPGAAEEERRAVLTLATVPRSDRKESMIDIENEIRAKLSAIGGARFSVGPPDSGVKMQIVLQSEDPYLLNATARQVEHELRTLQGIGNVNSSASLVRPEIVVRPDFARAADLGTTASAIGNTVRVATAGDYDTELTKINFPERQLPIRVKLPDSIRTNLSVIKHLTVPGRNGPVMLENVASVAMESGPAQINRINRNRNVTLNVELGRRTLGELNKEAQALPSIQHLPPGVHLAELGDIQEMKNLFASFGIAMIIGVLCIYGVLVLLFKDTMQPFTILAALPLSFGGAFLALLLTHKALSMPSMIGLIMLMGIASKNSILLVDYAMAALRNGMDRSSALIDACRKRSRPIVMTTIAMGAGMFPLALGWSTDPSFRSPMAVAVIGGLITSTLLSLFVIPVAFTYIDDLGCSLKRRFGKRLRAKSEAPHHMSNMCEHLEK